MTKIPVTGNSGSQMDYLEAELDLASIDKVDVRNELRRFTVFPATGTDFDFLAPYCNRRLLHYYITVFCGDPTRPDTTVTVCHAFLSRSNGWGTSRLSDGLKLGESTFLNTLSRLAKVPASEEIARYPN